MPAYSRSSSGLLADLEVGHVFQRTDHARVVPGLAAVSDTSVEEFLAGRGIGQAYADLASGIQRQIEILLVQLNAEAWVKGALDHAITVHFEDARRRKTAHQRLAHSAGVRTRLGCKQQRLGYGFDGQRNDELVRHLARLAIA